MPPQGHAPEWPDKAMFAALLLIVGGALGILVETLRLIGGATIKSGLPPGVLDAYPGWLSLAMAAVTLAFGVLSLRTQGAAFGYLGATAGLFSFAYSGLVPGLSILAIFMLIKSKMEGEETRNDGVTLHSSMWPDKAMAASLFLAVGAGVILVQGIAIALDNFDAMLLKKPISPWVPGTLDIVAGITMLVAAREVYNLRRSWLGYLGAVLGVVTVGLYALGPALAIIVVVLLRLAAKEGEFGPGEGVVPDITSKRAARKAERKKARAKPGA